MYSTELLSQCLRPHDGSSSKPDHSISCGFHYISLYRTRKAQGELLLCHYLSKKQRFQQVCGSTKAVNTRPKCHQRFCMRTCLYTKVIAVVIFDHDSFQFKTLYGRPSESTSPIKDITSHCCVLNVVKICTHSVRRALCSICCLWLPLSGCPK